jgi:nucleotide-binding universal stress UspA family protein
MERNPVIAATDGSDASLRAVEWAAREAALHGTALRIVSVAEMPGRMTWQERAPGALETPADLIRDAAGVALRSAAVRAAEIEPGLPVRTAILTGRAGPALASAGEEALMLVTGSRGAGGFAALVLGSVAREVATRSSFPVVVVREEAMAVHREIAVGIRDLTRPGALEFAFGEARLRKARLRVVHAWQLFLPQMRLTGTERPGADAGAVTAEAAAWLTEMLAPWREKYPDVAVLEDALHAHPGRLLTSASARADLVVLGRNDGQHRGAAPVLHAVLSHAHGPVAVIPE